MDGVSLAHSISVCPKGNKQDVYCNVLTFVDHSGTPTYLYYLNDLRYSVDALVDAWGNITERYKYNGYGERIVMNSSYSVQSSSSINQEYSYAGRRLDSEL